MYSKRRNYSRKDDSRRKSMKKRGGGKSGDESGNDRKKSKNVRGDLDFPYKRESYGYVKGFSFPTSATVRNAIVNLPIVELGESIPRESYDNYTINCVTDYYSEQQRLAAQVKSRDGGYNSTLVSIYPTVVDMYNKIAQPKGGDEHICNFFQREALFAKYPHHEATQFNVLLASIIYRATMEAFISDKHKKKRSSSEESMREEPSILSRIRVLDMSSGWGDRLIAALYSGADSYVGCDPNLSLQEAYTEIIDDATSAFGKTAWFANDEVVVEPTGFLELDLDEREPFHLAFTSPPFFAFEKYSNDDQQSINQFADYVEWRDKFYFPMIRKAFDAIIPGGFLVLHLAPTFAAESLVIDAKKCANKMPNCAELPDMMLDEKRNLGFYVWKKEFEGDDE